MATPNEVSVILDTFTEMARKLTASAVKDAEARAKQAFQSAVQWEQIATSYLRTLEYVRQNLKPDHYDGHSMLLIAQRIDTAMATTMRGPDLDPPELAPQGGNQCPNATEWWQREAGELSAALRDERAKSLKLERILKELCNHVDELGLPELFATATRVARSMDEAQAEVGWRGE